MKTKLILMVFLSLSVAFAQEKGKVKLPSEDESKFIEVEVVPSPLEQIAPVYPQLARLSGIEGKVYVKALIDEKGNVIKTEIMKSDNSVLDGAAVDAVKKSKFSPALDKQNKPVKVWVVIPMSFKLNINKKAEGKLLKYDELGPPPSNVKVEDPDMNEFIQVEKLPEMVEGAKPEYPELAKKNRIAGKVFVKVLVDKEGSPTKAVVIKSDSEILNQSAVDAAMKSKFTPAENKGEKLAVWVVLPFKYMLEMIEITSSWFSTVDSAATEYASLIKSIDQTGDYENIKHDKEKTKRLETDLKYGDESALFETEGKSYRKFLFITRKGRGIVRTTQESIDDLKQYIVKNMDKVFKDLNKKKRIFIFNTWDFK